MNYYNYSFVLKDEKSVFNFGRLLSRFIFPNFTIYLIGDLGVGKTTLARGIILGIFGGNYKIKSPTYSVVEVYSNFDFFVCHFDFYRILGVLEFDNVNIRDYMLDGGVFIIEWADKFCDFLPKPNLVIKISRCNAFHRELYLQSDSFFLEKLLS